MDMMFNNDINQMQNRRILPRR